MVDTRGQNLPADDLRSDGGEDPMTVETYVIAADASGAPAPVLPALPRNRSNAPQPLAYAGPLQQFEVESDPKFASRFTDLWLPIILIAIAILIQLSICLSLTALKPFMIGFGAYVVLKAIIMAVTIPLCIYFAGVGFGRFGQAVLKFAAIALLPDAIFSSSFHWGWTGTFGVFVAIGVTWILFGCLFRQDWHESRACTLVLFVVTLLPAYLWYRIYLWLSAEAN